MKPTIAQLPSLTVVFTVKTRLHDVVELENEGARCCKEPSVATDVLDIGPNDSVFSGWFRGRSAPYLGAVSLSRVPSNCCEHTFSFMQCESCKPIVLGPV